MRIKLTVFFEDPFWVGVFEREDESKYEIAKFTFGAEPKDCEVYRLIITAYKRLRFSQPFGIEKTNTANRINPKRLQRIAQREVSAKGIGTKAQQALQMEYERNKVARKALSKEQKEEAKRAKFEQKRLIKKEKHKGH